MPTAKHDKLLISASYLFQRAEILSDVYETVLYAACLNSNARGGFLSTDGVAYFDMAIGSYRSDRMGKKGGIKIWQYDTPGPGKIIKCSYVWLYRAKTNGWLIGINADTKPQMAFLEGLSIAANTVVEHIRKKEIKTEGRDALTGLLDRATFYRDISHLAEVAQKTGNNSLYLLFIDLNNFKVINDMLGHDMGDRVLRSQAAEIRKQVSGYGNAYRYGGDEFVVVIIGANNEKINEIAKRIEIVSEQAPGGYSVSASVGIEKYDCADDVETFVRKADKKMYARKEDIKKQEAQKPACDMIK